MITEEYRKKVENFIKNIPNRIYKPVAEVEFKGFFTYDRMSLDEAMDCKKEWCLRRISVRDVYL